MIERETNYKKDLKVILQTFNCNSINLKISKSFTFDSNYFFRFLFDPCREKTDDWEDADADGCAVQDRGIWR